MEDSTPTRTVKARFNPITALLDKLDYLLTGHVDADARRRGLTVTRVPGSREHIYRDPRWDERREAMLNGADWEPVLLDRGRQS